VAKINVELDYKDFYAILELTGRDPDNEKLIGIHDRFLERVFELAAEQRDKDTGTFTWMTPDKVRKLWGYETCTYQLRGKRVAVTTPEKIKAIKMIRILSAKGLKDAKDYIDVVSSYNPPSWVMMNEPVTLSGSGATADPVLNDLENGFGFQWQLRMVGD
jgi:hypothetical protein